MWGVRCAISRVEAAVSVEVRGRDGAFVAEALEKAGYPELCRMFFDFCSRALEDGGYRFQHYNPDGSQASNWHAGGYELDEVDNISLLGLVTLAAFPAADARVVVTVEAIRRELVVDSPIGGVARYRNDRYQRESGLPESIPGNPWFISTLRMGE